MNKSYEYVIVGAGIAGCSTAYFLSKYTNSILLVDRNCDIAQGASGAAGAFLSPLLGKPNPFKDLVTKALKFSTKFYKEIASQQITNCGVVRIAKTDDEQKKFESYKPYMDFEFTKEQQGYFFDIGSGVNSYEMCKILAKNIQTKTNYELVSYERVEDYWLLNNEIKTKNLILTTGADVSLINEKYFKIRAVWGQKIDIHSSSVFTKNYHKACSISYSKKTNDENIFKTSIGATHDRIQCNLKVCNHCLQEQNLSENGFDTYTKELVKSNNEQLLAKAAEIKEIKSAKIVDIKIGPRASSVDYFPMVGKLIDSKKSLECYPHLKNGSFIKDKMLKTIDNLYVLNGVGGRGYVLSPYLAYNLVEQIQGKEYLDQCVLTHRLFKRWVKKNN